MFVQGSATWSSVPRGAQKWMLKKKKKGLGLRLGLITWNPVHPEIFQSLPRGFTLRSTHAPAPPDAVSSTVNYGEQSVGQPRVSFSETVLTPDSNLTDIVVDWTQSCHHIV